MNNRRLFLATICAGSFSCFDAWAAASVDEKDAQATALGYAADASRVDAAQYPKYQKGQVCGKCAFYQGSATDAAGPCPLMGGKNVSAKGWCNTWMKKP